MPIDASIYSQLKPVEMPSVADAHERGMRLSQLAMQQQRMGKQMQREDREAAHQEHLRKASVFGNELESLSGLPEDQRAQAYTQVRQNLVNSGVIGPQDAPEQYDPGFYRQSLFRFRQTKEHLDKQLQQAQIAKLRAESVRSAQKPLPLTKAQESVDKEAGKTYADWILSGGRADADKGVSQLEGAIEQLEGGFSTIGPVAGRLVPDVLSPSRTAVRESVEEVVQRNLRSVLGAQFTEKEGERLISRAYNEKLSPEENVQRLKRLAGQMRAAMEAKDKMAAYYEQNGTLVGYKGERPSIRMFDNLGAVAKKDSGAFGTNAHAKEGPKPGAVEDGFVYMGGDPSNPKSWKRAR